MLSFLCLFHLYIIVSICGSWYKHYDMNRELFITMGVSCLFCFTFDLFATIGVNILHELTFVPYFKVFFCSALFLFLNLLFLLVCIWCSRFTLLKHSFDIKLIYMSSLLVLVWLDVLRSLIKNHALEQCFPFTRKCPQSFVCCPCLFFMTPQT